LRNAPFVSRAEQAGGEQACQANQEHFFHLVSSIRISE
jgi:hypothetical protein